MNSPYRVHPALPLRDQESTEPWPVQLLRPKVIASDGASAKPEAPNKLALLLKIEGEIRQLPSWNATVFHALNETSTLLGFEQGFFFRANNRDVFSAEAASAVAAVDSHAPLIGALTSVVNRIAKPGECFAFDLREILRSQTYGLDGGLWLPVKDGRGRVFGGFLLAKPGAWAEDQQQIAKRLMEAYGHGLRVQKPPVLLKMLSMPRWMMWSFPTVLALLAFVPVPLTTLAPFEVVPFDAAPVTSPIEGVISEILAEANSPIKAGQILFKFDATKQQADASIAEQRVVVAEAKLLTARSGAFADADAKKSMAVIEKELLLARAEYDYMLSVLSRVNVVAPTSGMLVYSAKADWLGKPVRVGEKVMEVADPAHIAYRIDLGVHDAIAMGKNASVRLFLDADPLHPRTATLYEESYHAVEKTAGSLAYTLKAKPEVTETMPARLGLRGTAQLSGERVSLGFYLFRRPIAALRQYVGW